MKKSVKNEMVLLLIVAFLFWSDASFSFSRQQKSPVIDVKHIALDLRFSWEKKQASGTAAITLSLMKPGDRVALDAVGLSITEIKLSNGTMCKYDYNDTLKSESLHVFLDKKYAAGENFTLQITYHTNYVNNSDPNNIWGSTGKGIRFFEPTSTEPRRRKQLWTTGFPEGNRYWFPCHDVADDLRTTELKATVDKQMTVVSNGVLISETANNDGTLTFNYRMDTPYANYNTGIVVSEYKNVKQPYENVVLNNYSYPDEEEATAASVERLPDMMRYFSEITGLKYPYRNYSQVFVQDLPYGMANTTASVQTENMVDDFRTHAEYYYLWDMLEGESLAQQWFGGSLSHKTWSDVWLTKSFARYFSELYCEHKNGKDEFLLYQRTYDLGTQLADWSIGVRQPVVNSNYTDVTDYVNSNQVYLHGASVLQMLRKHLGDKKWDQLIKHYVKANAGKTVTTSDFQKSAELIAGEKLNWFFDQWLYSIGHPVFEVKKKYDADRRQLILEVLQTQEQDTITHFKKVKYFKGKMDIALDGEVQTVWLQAKHKNVFVFNLQKEPRLVNFDHESSWVKEMIFEKSMDELIYQFENDKDILGQQWAMAELVEYSKKETTSATDKEKIVQAFRNVVAGRSYWRMRFNALWQLPVLLGEPGKTLVIDKATENVLLDVIKNEKAWLRTAAVAVLGNTHNAQHADVYIELLNDECDRVINAAATALGKTKDVRAFDLLVKLKNKPSWKNQSLISALNGLKELGDSRGGEIAYAALLDLQSPRWTLATPVWDYRLAAAVTAKALGKSKEVYTVILERFKKAMIEKDVIDIFNNTLTIALLADERGKEIFDTLKENFKNDNNAMQAVLQYENQWSEGVKSN